MIARIFLVTAICMGLQGCGAMLGYCLLKDQEQKHVPVLCDW